MTAADEWDQAATADAYEAFCGRHARYREANQSLAAHAALEPGQRVLDVGAGTGRTADALLPTLGPTGTLTCFEPALAMRLAGAERLRDPRVSWVAEWPGEGGFDPCALEAQPPHGCGCAVPGQSAGGRAWLYGLGLLGLMRLRRRWRARTPV